MTQLTLEGSISNSICTLIAAFSQVISMLSACKISVLSQKARLKYTLQYMRSIECVEIEESEVEEKAKEPPVKLGIVHDIFFYHFSIFYHSELIV